MRRFFRFLFLVIFLLSCFPIHSHAVSAKYYDNEADLSFSIPDGWSEKDFIEERDGLDVKLVKASDSRANGASILYGSVDLWSEMTPAERSGLKRSDLNDDAVSAAQIAEEYGVPVTQIKDVYYGGVHYYKIDLTYSSVAAAGIKTIQLFHVHNGWIYLFQFSGTSTQMDLFYGEFEGMLKTVEYPQEETSAGDIVWTVVGIICALAIFSVFILQLVLRLPAKKRRYASVTDTPQLCRKPDAYCFHCGQALDPDSQFCPRCGTKTNQ